MRELFKLLGGRGPDEIEQAIKAADGDKDGKIGKAEFIAWFRKNPAGIKNDVPAPPIKNDGPPPRGNAFPPKS